LGTINPCHLALIFLFELDILARSQLEFDFFLDGKGRTRWICVTSCFIFVVGWEGGWANKTKTSVMAQQNAARGRSQGSSGMSLGRD